MPNYLYKCSKCGAEDYEVRKVEDRNEPKKCEKVLAGELHTGNQDSYYSTQCNGEMKLKIGNPFFKFKD